MEWPLQENIEVRQNFFKNLLKSHMVIALLGGFSLLIALVIISVQSQNVRVLSSQSIPITRASASILVGVQSSLAHLRGWVSLGDRWFVNEWYRVWDEEIDSSVNELVRLRFKRKLPGSERRMVELKLLLAELRESQWWVLEEARTPGNQPALAKYQLEAEPILAITEEIIQGLINNTEREKPSLLKSTQSDILHVITINFYQINEMLRKIVVNGQIDLEDQYVADLRELNEMVSDLSSSQLYNEELNEIIDSLVKELVALRIISREIINIRKSSYWNVVQHSMETETVPIAKRVSKLINGLVRDTDRSMFQQVAAAKNTGDIASFGLIGLGVFMIWTAYMISRRRALALARPVTFLSDAATKLSEGTLVEDIPVTGDDELAVLTQSFNTMRKDLKIARDGLLRQERLAAIGQLSGSVAHDIRNPLGIINNSIYYLNLISSDETNEKKKEHLSLMQREINRANEIINDLLDFSRDNVPQFAKANMNMFLRQYVSKVDFPENVSVEYQLDEDVPMVSFDISQIQRVFQNLLSNAAQAMPEGGMIRISSKMSGTGIEIEVGDNGIGISEEDIKSVFEPLFTTRTSGVGLGLSIVKDFVEKHNGVVNVKSEIGKGTTFSIHLPINQEG